MIVLFMWFYSLPLCVCSTSHWGESGISLIFCLASWEYNCPSKPHILHAIFYPIHRQCLSAVLRMLCPSLQFISPSLWLGMSFCVGDKRDLPCRVAAVLTLRDEKAIRPWPCSCSAGSNPSIQCHHAKLMHSANYSSVWKDM